MRKTARAADNCQTGRRIPTIRHPSIPPRASPNVMTSRRRKIHALLVVLAALSVQACSPTRPPVEELDAASRALGAARDAGAPTYAAAEYRSAGQRFDQAQAAESRRDFDAAAQLARESAADGELATAKSRLAKAREAVARLRQENAALDRNLTEHADAEAQP